MPDTTMEEKNEKNMEGTFIKQIGSIIFIVKERQSENAKHNLESAVKALIKKEAETIGTEDDQVA